MIHAIAKWKWYSQLCLCIYEQSVRLVLRFCSDSLLFFFLLVDDIEPCVWLCVHVFLVASWKSRWFFCKYIVPFWNTFGLWPRSWERLFCRYETKRKRKNEDRSVVFYLPLICPLQFIFYLAPILIHVLNSNATALCCIQNRTQCVYSCIYNLKSD